MPGIKLWSVLFSSPVTDHLQAGHNEFTNLLGQHLYSNT